MIPVEFMEKEKCINIQPIAMIWGYFQKRKKKKEIIKKMQEVTEYNIKNNVNTMVHSLQISELLRELKSI